MDFHQNLSALRKKNNLTQEQLAEKLNITRQAVSKWESGISLPDLSLVPKMCRILGVTADQLILNHETVSPEKKEKTDPREKDLPLILTAVFLMVYLVANMILFLILFVFVGAVAADGILYFISGMILLTLLTFAVLMIRETKKRNQYKKETGAEIKKKGTYQ